MKRPFANQSHVMELQKEFFLLQGILPLHDVLYWVKCSFQVASFLRVFYERTTNKEVNPLF